MASRADGGAFESMSIVIFNGGRGARNLISSLLETVSLPLISIVNAYDDGKSTGEIRRLFNIPGPSDLRKTMEVMLPTTGEASEMNRRLFELRMPVDYSEELAVRALEDFVGGKTLDLFGLQVPSDDTRSEIKRYLTHFLEAYKLFNKMTSRSFGFSDCSLMNCIFAGAFFASGRNYTKAINELACLFRSRGQILLNSEEIRCLFGVRGDGTFLKSEAEIVELRSNFSMEEIFFADHWIDNFPAGTVSKEEMIRFGELSHHPVYASAEVLNAIREAQVIIYAPGTQHSSLYPTYMTVGLCDAIVKNKTAKKVFITNIGADYETPTFKATDYVNGALKYLKRGTLESIADSDVFTHIFANFSSNEGLNYVENDFKDSKYEDLVVYKDFENRNQLGTHDGGLLTSCLIEIL